MAKIGTIEAVITAKVEPLRRALDEATRGFVQFEGRVTASQKQAQQLSAVLNREVAQATNKAERGVRSLAASTLNLSRAIGAAAVAWASSKLVQGLNDFARTAHEAEAGARVFEKMLARVGESSRRVEPELQALADELRVAPEIIRSNASELLRAGYTWDQIATIYRGAGASALLAGKSTAEGIDIATSALVSGLSTYLNQIGIVQNLSTAYTQYARQLGKTVEQLTDAERAQAATLMIQRATAQEVEDLQLLFEGYGGAVSELNRAWYDFKVALGSLVMPVVEQVIRILTRAVELATEAINRLRQLAGREPVEVLAPVEATVQQAAEAGEDAGREWAVAFAREANKLVDLIAPGHMFEIYQPLSAVGVIGGEIESVLGPPEVWGGPEAVRDWLGLADATQEELDKVLDVVRSFGTSLQRELDLERELSFALGEPFDEAAVKVRALQRLLREMVETFGVPISSPFAQQLLEWIDALRARPLEVKPEPSDVARFLESLYYLIGPDFYTAGTPSNQLKEQLERLQQQVEGENVILAEAARRQIDAALKAFHDAFLETGDAAIAVAAALKTFEAEVERTGMSTRAIQAYSLRYQKMAEAWEASLPWWEKLSRGLRDMAKVASDWVKGMVSRLPGVQDALEAYKHATTSAARGGLGLSWMGGLAAGALAFVAANSEALADAIDLVADGLRALLIPLEALLDLLGPTLSGMAVGAGLGAAAGSIFGPIGAIVGGAIGAIAGLIGGTSQKVEEAAQKQIEAAQELAEAARSMTTEDRYGAIAQAQKAMAETEQRLAQTRSQLKSVAVGGTVAGAGLGAAAGFLIGGPVGALVGAILGGIIGGGSTKKAAQKELEALQKQLEAQEEALRQIIADFKSALGISVSDLVSSVKSAFSARTVEDFTSQMETSLRKHVRDAMVAAFLESAAMRPLFEALSDAIFEAVRDGVLSAGELDAIEDIISQITDKSAAFFEVLDELGLSMEDLADTTREVNEALRNVPTGFKITLRRFQVQDPIPMAEGGIVTSPTIALIGEAGPEAVVPLGGDGAALGTTIVVNIEGPVYGVDDLDRRITKAVGRAMRQARMATYGVT